jgi:hypothetical protein
VPAEFFYHIFRFVDDDGEPVNTFNFRRRGIHAVDIDFPSGKNDRNPVQ